MYTIQWSVQWCLSAQMATPVVSTFSTSIRLSSSFIKHCILPPYVSLSLPPPSLSLWYPIPFSELVLFPSGLEMLVFSSCKANVFAVRTHSPSSDHFHTDAVVPSSDHCRTETVLPPSDQYGIDSVAPSGDHYCIDIVVPSSDHFPTETVPPSSDHYGTTKEAHPSDHLHTKIK